MNWVNSSPDNGLLPIQCQAITWTNADLISIGSLGTNFNKISIEITKYSCKKLYLKHHLQDIIHFVHTSMCWDYSGVLPKRNPTHIFLKNYSVIKKPYKTSAISNWQKECTFFVRSIIAEDFLMHFNSFPPSNAYMCQWIGLELVQIMACRLFGAKPLSKLMLGYCQLDP